MGSVPHEAEQQKAARDPSPRRVLALWSAALLVLWVALLRFPLIPAQPTSEDGWRFALGSLFRARSQAGVDWLFTYGPLGFFVERAFDTSLDTARCLFEVALKGAFALAALGILRRQGSLVLQVPTYLALLSLPRGDDDAADALLALFLGLLLLDERGGSRPLRAARILVLAVLSLAKFSLLLFAGATVALAAAQRIRRGRPGGALEIVLVFALALLAVWVAAGQAPGNLPAYLRESLDLAGAYTGAMSRMGPDLELAAALAVLALGALALALRGGLRPLAREPEPALLFALAAWFALRTGFTRQDPEHSARFFAAAIPALFALPLAAATGSGAIRASRVLLFVAGAVAAVALGRALRAIQFGSEAWPAPLENLAQAADALARPAARRARLESELAALRASNGLPRVRERIGAERVDHLGMLTMLPLVNELRWDPRFVFLSYAAFTDRIARRNAAHFEGGEAPPFLLVDGQVIDKRFPTQEDGEAVLHALAGYRPELVEERVLLLRRASMPGASVLPRPETSVAADLASGQVLELPAGEGVLIARIACRPSPWGRLRSLAWRSRSPRLEVELDHGKWARFRLLPSLPHTSFLLGPVLRSLDDWIDAYAAGAHLPRPVRLRILDPAGDFAGFRVEVDLVPGLVRNPIGADEARVLRAELHRR